MNERLIAVWELVDLCMYELDELERLLEERSPQVAFAHMFEMSRIRTTLIVLRKLVGKHKKLNATEEA
jgi:hypothetical protein